MSSLRSKRGWAAALVAAALVASAIIHRDDLVAWFLGHEEGHGGAGAGGGDVAYYTCSMDPSVEAHEPGKCPICGMDLTPVTKKERDSDVLRFNAATMRRIGVRTAAAERRALERRVTAFGVVAEPDPAPAARAPSARVDAVVLGADGSAAAVGQVASASVFALPLMRFEGSVIQVRPDPEAKATQLRVVLADPGLTLRPGMHAEVQIEVALAERLVVPARAIIHAGPRRLAFVDRGGGQLEPRKLEIGAQVDGFVEVRGGLIAGERVVVSGTFLVAAESRIRSRSKLWADEPPAAPPTRVKPAAKPPKPAEQPTRGGTR